MERLYATAKNNDVKNRTLIPYGQAKGTQKEMQYDAQKSFSWDLQQYKVKQESARRTTFTFSFNYANGALVCSLVI